MQSSLDQGANCTPMLADVHTLLEAQPHVLHKSESESVWGKHRRRAQYHWQTHEEDKGNKSRAQCSITSWSKGGRHAINIGLRADKAEANHDVKRHVCGKNTDMLVRTKTVHIATSTTCNASLNTY